MGSRKISGNQFNLNLSHPIMFDYCFKIRKEPNEFDSGLWKVNDKDPQFIHTLSVQWLFPGWASTTSTSTSIPLPATCWTPASRWSSRSTPTEPPTSQSTCPEGLCRIGKLLPDIYLDTSLRTKYVMNVTCLDSSLRIKIETSVQTSQSFAKWNSTFVVKTQLNLRSNDFLQTRVAEV